MMENDKNNLENNGDLSADELLKLLKANLTEDKSENTAAEKTNTEEILDSESEEIAAEPSDVQPSNALEGETPEESVHINKPKKYKFVKTTVRIPASEEEADEDADNTETKEIAIVDENSSVVEAAEETTDEDVDNTETKEIKIIDENSSATETDAEELEADVEETETVETDENQAEETGAPLDSTDINLMMALGLEEELEQTIGIDKITEMAASNELVSSDNEKTEIIKPSDSFKDEEYESYEQSKGIFENYRDLIAKIKLRIIGTSIFALCIFILENLHIIGINLPGMFDYAEYPSSYTFIGLQLLLLCAALSYKELFAGIKDIIAFEFSPYSIAALAVAFTGVCDLIIGFFGNRTSLNLYNFAAAFYLILCILGEYFSIRREVYNFNVISANRPKYAVIASESKKTVASNFLDEEVVTDLNVKRADFIGGFFKRTKAPAEDNNLISYFAVASLLAAVIFALISYTHTKNINAGVAVANLTALMCLPASVFACYALPPFICVKKAFETKSTIIGDNSSKEYSGASGVIFDDKDVFPSRSVKLKSVKVYEDTRIDTVLSDISSIFAKLGGPVGEVLEHATAEIEHSENVEISEVTELGITATVGASSYMLVGKKEYMEQHNIVPEYDYEDEVQLAGGNVRIMYVAYGDKICAKLYIQYSVEAEFENIVRQFGKNGIDVIIRTFDPNIDDRLLASEIVKSKCSAKIERYDMNCIDTPKEEKTYSGIVSLSSIKAVAKTILLCEKLNHVKMTANIIKYMSVIVGFLIMLIFTLSNTSSILLSLFVAIYHLFWVLPVFIISKVYLK